MAFHSFHSEFGHFPPAASRDASGTPLLSWRVHLLPFMGYHDLYSQFHFDEPWDSPHNRTLLEEMPEEYLTGEDGENHTSFVVFLGDDAVFGGERAEHWSRPLRPYVRFKQSSPPKTEISEEELAASMRRRRARKHGGPRIADIQDGTSNTILVVQAGDDRQVPWTKPEDVLFQPENPLAALGDVPESGFLALYCDGKVKLISRDVTSDELAAAITRAGRDDDR